ncbi:amino acid ABC transporter ATP-binding protein [Tissierella sp. Yu-01]|uniref:amino acid ABC transporter ATP-binding protein n=1 Tax=Tissierella sp. Yu-01 TaxID=3035694 RepID=UPI00240E3BB1|nr:amino acid ABC transporter ATP-binding protein [Tissierella sp. Yu-01]WFA08843.1 amino acid ABC transporter ATP-binding protein [Tissierella sp. Yu-01]
MLKLKNINKYFGEFQALENINIEFEKGKTTVILGPSGSGKSTMLRCINLLEVPESGTLQVGDIILDFKEKVDKNRVIKIRKKTAMVFQSFNLFPHMKVLGNVIEGPVTVLNRDKSSAIEMGRMLLEKVGLSDKETSYPEQLSGGQQQRVAIARALAIEPEFLLFDEPTSALDPELESEVLRVLKDLAHEDKSMIIVTHNLDFAREVADRIIFLENGVVEYDGSTENFFNNSNNDRIKRFINSMKP